MFSKRATPKKKKTDNDDDDGDGERSPTIVTVSIPQDALDHSPTSASASNGHLNGQGSTASSHRSSFAIEASKRGNNGNNVQPHQPWKPWNPDGNPTGATGATNVDRRRRSGSIHSPASPQLSTLSSLSSSSPPSNAASSSSLGATMFGSKSSTIPSPSTSGFVGSLQANSLMLNLTGLFSGSTASSTGPSTFVNGGSSAVEAAGQQQPVEARLWNADQPQLVSPLSPAGPRYIPAVAGSSRFGAAAVSSPTSGTGGSGIRETPASPTMTPNGRGGSLQWSSFGQPRQQQHQQQPQHDDLYQPSQSLSAASAMLAKTPSSPGQARSATIAAMQEPPLSGSSSFSTATMATRTTRQKKEPEHEMIGSVGISHGTEYNRSLQSKRWDDYRGSDHEDNDDIGFESKTHGPDAMGHRSKEEQDHRYNRRRFKRGHGLIDGWIGRLEDYFETKTGRAPPLLLRDPKRVMRARLFCLRQNRRLHPAFRLVLIVFLAGSVCFTTWHLMFAEGDRQSRTRVTLNKGLGNVKEQGQRVKELLSKGKAGTGSDVGGDAGLDGDPALSINKKVISAFDIEALNYSSHQWNLETNDIDNSKAVVRIGEDYMLSKAYSGAMQPTRVIPFYFRASFEDENDDDDFHVDEFRDQSDDFQPPPPSQPGQNSSFTPPPKTKVDRSLVTITTLITPDRYGVFLKLVRQYRGPISVATHIQRGDEQDRQFTELNRFFEDNAVLRKYVDLHVIIDGVDFQLNMWRNIARMFARTDYFMMLDVDFHIPSGLKNRLHHDPHIQRLLSSGAALVVPAFEYKEENDPKDSKFFPDTKLDLMPLLEKGHVHVFHDFFPPGHGATDTPRWIKMSEARYKEQQRLEAMGGVKKISESEAIQRRVDYDEDNDQAAAFPIEIVPAAGDDKDRSLFIEHEIQAKLKMDKEREVIEEAAREKERQEYLELEAEGERPYKVTNFEPKYEPYIILKREGTPWCDERFVGYGGNKAACLFDIYISGVDFWVLPQDFLIHQYHDYPTTNRKNGRILNKQLFISFQQEICFATLRRMIKTGEWYTDKAQNLRHQCGAFEGFLRSADQMANDFEMDHPNSLLEDPVFVLEDEEGGNNEVRKEEEQLAMRDQHAVDDEDVQDPFLSPRPKGKTWGGIKIKTFYVPPPPEEGADLPGIDANVEENAAGVGPVEGGLGTDNSQQGDAAGQEQLRDGTGGFADPYLPQSNGEDLTGERLEQFRQGVILKPLDAHGQSESEGENGTTIPGNVVSPNDNSGSGDVGQSRGGEGGEDSPTFGRKVFEGMGSRSPSGSIRDKDGNEVGDGGGVDGSFEEAAVQLEERVRQLGLA